MLSFSVPNIFLLNGYSLFPVRFNKFMVDMVILAAILLMLK